MLLDGDLLLEAEEEAADGGFEWVLAAAEMGLAGVDGPLEVRGGGPAIRVGGKRGLGGDAGGTEGHAVRVLGRVVLGWRRREGRERGAGGWEGGSVGRGGKKGLG